MRSNKRFVYSDKTFLGTLTETRLVRPNNILHFFNFFDQHEI